jgi:threonine/homoserine/homoserine lactone efflux protein
MNLHLFAAYCLAVAILLLVPGPVVALVDPRLPAGPQLLVMIGAMIVMAFLSDSSYALLAARARSWFTVPQRRRLQSRIAGTLLIGVGCGLLVARRGS